MAAEALTIEVELGQLAASIFTPDGGADPALPLLFCIPGMTYTSGYYDLRFDGHDGYSFAAAMTARGYVVATVDNLGTGASSRPGIEVDLAAIAAANAEAAATIRARVSATRVVGIGHSMGGGVLVAQQSGHGSFDAIAALGFSTQKLAGIYEDHANEAALTFEERTAWAREHIPPKIWGAEWTTLDPFFTLDRAGFRDLFYRPDVPDDIVAADTLTATCAPRQAALDIITPGIGARFAAGVRGPVFLAFGDTDLSPDPRAEVGAYAASDDITLMLLPDSAHCHNLASSRALLWDRLDAWVRGLA